MSSADIAVIVFSVLAAVVVLFQLALAFGAPWGELAMGGKFPGRFPVKMRIAALIQACLMVIIALVVSTRAGLSFSNLFTMSKTLMWFVVALLALGVILNLITPSKKERALWGPISIVMFISALIVAFLPMH